MNSGGHNSKRQPQHLAGQVVVYCTLLKINSILLGDTYTLVTVAAFIFIPQPLHSKSSCIEKHELPISPISILLYSCSPDSHLPVGDNLLLCYLLLFLCHRRHPFSPVLDEPAATRVGHGMRERCRNGVKEVQRRRH